MIENWVIRYVKYPSIFKLRGPEPRHSGFKVSFNVGKAFFGSRDVDI